MPILFVYTPLLLDGSYFEIAATVVACIIGVVAWVAYLERYGLRRTEPVERLLLGLAALCLLLPVDRFANFVFGVEQTLLYQTYVIGIVLAVTVFIIQKTKTVRQAG